MTAILNKMNEYQKHVLLKILFIFRERGREREGEKHQCVIAPRISCNPGIDPDWKLNQLPFGLQACAQSTEPHQPGLKNIMFN